MNALHSDATDATSTIATPPVQDHNYSRFMGIETHTSPTGSRSGINGSSFALMATLDDVNLAADISIETSESCADKNFGNCVPSNQCRGKATKRKNVAVDAKDDPKQPRKRRKATKFKNTKAATNTGSEAPKKKEMKVAKWIVDGLLLPKPTTLNFMRPIKLRRGARPTIATVQVRPPPRITSLDTMTCNQMSE